MFRILIADDHPMVRTGLREWLAKDPAVAEIGEARTGEETLEQMRRARWDLVVLDVNMPDRSGLDILRHIRAHHAETPVLVVSGFPESQYAINLLRAGAAGYLAKDHAPEQFLNAVRTVLAGRRFITPSLADLLVQTLETPTQQPRHAALSHREFQIFCKLATGATVAEIAHELYLSPKTVSSHRARVLDKMSLGNSAELTAYAVRNGLVQ
jgi:two-component system, NarL family, invasion response regulator UvrY